MTDETREEFIERIKREIDVCGDGQGVFIYMRDEEAYSFASNMGAEDLALMIGQMMTKVPHLLLHMLMVVMAGSSPVEAREDVPGVVGPGGRCVH